MQHLSHLSEFLSEISKRLNCSKIRVVNFEDEVQDSLGAELNNLDFNKLKTSRRNSRFEQDFIDNKSYTLQAGFTKSDIGLLDISNLNEAEIVKLLDDIMEIAVGVVITDNFRSEAEFKKIIQNIGLKKLVYGNFNEDLNEGKDSNYLFSFCENISVKKVLDTEVLKILCILSVRNEIDLIDDALNEALHHGFDLHIIDNWSDDGTWELIEKKYSDKPNVTIERFPSTRASNFSLRSLLKRCEIIANQAEHDWIIRLDADERVASSSPDYNLREVIELANMKDYDVIDFTVFEFRPTEVDRQFQATYPEFGYFTGLSSHQNIQRAWRNKDKRIMFANSGGHEISGQNNLFPTNQLLRHYSFRSPEQSHRKVFHDRIPRYNLKERVTGWHHHYDNFKVSDTMLWDSSTLLKWNDTSIQKHSMEITLRAGEFPTREPKMFSITETHHANDCQMKDVLLCALNIFANVPNGGGGTYKKIIESNPDIHFFAFSTSREIGSRVPQNLTEILVNDAVLTGDVLGGLLEAVHGSSFDIIDIPDWLTPQHSIREKLEKECIKTSKIIAALHGSNSRVIATKPKSMRNRALVRFLRRKESILYKESDSAYGYSEKYAKMQRYKSKFHELSAFPMCNVPDTNFPEKIKEKLIIPVFFGRKEYTKGYDLFLELIKGNQIFSPAKVMAPTAFGSEEYEKILLLELNVLDYLDESFIASQSQVLNLVNTPNTLFIFPSRFDSFNLSFIQVLLAGGVAACSNNVNARIIADKLGLKYVDLKNNGEKTINNLSVSLLQEIRLHNYKKLSELKETIVYGDMTTFRGIYV